jgi:carbon-monoxide dehydrogenase medium subunit
LKSRKFEYVRAQSIAEAVEALRTGEDAKILAGGQSLVAALNLRLASADLVVDINHIPGLAYIDLRENEIAIGALVRHAEVERSDVVAKHLPLIKKAMRHVAHPAVRNRGTTCGSLAYADPSAEMPACAIALDAVLVLESVAGRREVRARDFFW